MERSQRQDFKPQTLHIFGSVQIFVSNVICITTHENEIFKIQNCQIKSFKESEGKQCK